MNIDPFTTATSSISDPKATTLVSNECPVSPPILRQYQYQDLARINKSVFATSFSVDTIQFLDLAQDFALSTSSCAAHSDTAVSMVTESFLSTNPHAPHSDTTPLSMDAELFLSSSSCPASDFLDV